MDLLDTTSGPVAYDERGAGPAIVLLPSGAHDHHDFDELRALLPDGVRTIALDWPGHGASPLGDGPATAMRFADIAEEVVERLVPEGAVVVGNSVGGFAAGRMAARRPGARPRLGPHRRRRLRRPPAARARLLRADGAALVSPKRSTPPSRRAMCGPAPTPTAAPATPASPRPARIRACAPSPSCGAASPHRARSPRRGRDDHGPDARALGPPRPRHPLKLGRRVAEPIPEARLVVFDSGHVPHTTDPAGVAAELVPFCEHHLDSM